MNDEEECMSVVTVKVDESEITLSSDSFIGSDWEQSKITFVKQFQVNGILAGFAGSAEEGSLLRIFSQNHAPKNASEESIIDFFVEFTDWAKKKDDHFKLDNQYLFIFKQKAYYCSGLYAREITDNWAIGAGQIHAKAALYLGHSAPRAVEVACELSPFCEKPINTTVIKRKKLAKED